MKILLIRFSSIGDIVLTTPVVRCIKEQLKEVELHYLTAQKFASVIKENKYLDKVHLLETGKTSELIGQLKKEQFDYILDLHNNLKSIKLTKALGVPTKRFFKANIEKWMYVNWKINRLPKNHIVDRYLATASHLGVTNDHKGLDHFLPEINIPEHQLPPFINKSFVGFVIGGAHQTKCLPANKIARILNNISTEPIILLGGPDDTEKAKEILRLTEHKQIFNACGKFSLHESAWLVKKANRIITHDTGLMHIAAAFKKPIISVWGNTVPEFGMYPYLPTNAPSHRMVEVQNLPCRPCSKIGYKKCPKGHFKCMNEMDEQAFS